MKNKIKKHTGDYHKYLVNSLKDPDEAKAYLNASLEEEGTESFLMALRNVVEAQGISRTAKMTGLNRVSFYKMLSKNGNPGVISLYAILRALGFFLRVDSIKQAA